MPRPITYARLRRLQRHYKHERVYGRSRTEALQSTWRRMRHRLRTPA